MQHLSVCSFSSNDQSSLRRHVCREIDQQSWQIFNHLIASGAKLLASHDFKGGCLHEEVTNSQSSKKQSCQFVHILSNGEGLNSIWASLNFWSHCESCWPHVASKKIKGYVAFLPRSNSTRHYFQYTFISIRKQFTRVIPLNLIKQPSTQKFFKVAVLCFVSNYVIMFLFH